jgi:hypothetical protein
LIRAQVNEFAKHGFRTVVFNPRGVGIPQITTKIFDASKNTEDLDYILQILFKKYPQANFYLAGSSFGACTSVRYVTTFDHGNRIKGIVSMANPFDLYKAAEYINHPSNQIFGKFMTKNLLKKVKRNRDAIRMWEMESGTELDWNKLEHLTNTFQFDEEVTFKIHTEYTDHRTYYERVSCTPFVKDLEIPTLFLHSKDDPICP